MPMAARAMISNWPLTNLAAALTGAVTPAGYKIPETPQQIADEAYDAWKTGAAIVHLHMRADDGLGAMDKEKFRETIKLIRSHKDCDVIINCTSSGASPEHPATDEERMAHHRELAGIEMGSYDAGTFNWMPGGVFINSPQFLQKLGDLYMEKGIKPELEIFDAGMLGVANYFVKKGHLSTPCHFQFCLGVLGGMAVPAVQRFGYGFVQGADAAAVEMGIADQVVMEYAYGNQFYGDSDITAYMDNWYQTLGVQVVFASGGGIYTSAAEAAAKVGGKLIGVDVDQSSLAPENIICSSLLDHGYATYDTISQAVNGQFNNEQVYYGLQEGMPVIAINEALVSEEIIQQVKDIEQKIIAGEIEIPTTTETE